MIRKKIRHTPFAVFLLVWILFFTPVDGVAQFIDLQLQVDSKLKATTEQALNFGTISSNSGRRMIELGSINMGIFSITGLEQQLLLINLDKPDKLRHTNPAIKDKIPLQLFSRYGYSSQNYQDSFILPEAISTIKVESNPEPGPWNTVYIFMYGAINIGDVADGVYSNEILLNVEYI